MNRILNKLSLLAILAIAQPAQAIAESHTVIVRDNFFDPRDLVIAVGDTVVWVSDSDVSCGPYGNECSGGVMHTVTADDLLFSSGTPSDGIFFAHNFDDTAVILYHCEVHSESGKDINSFMNGRISVKGAETVFQINAGINDAWFNPDTDGQGFFITAFPVLGVVLLAWFTYETELVEGMEAKLGDAGHRWLIAVGSFIDNKAIMSIEMASGGVFATGTEIQRRADGTVTLILDDCNSGTVEYDIPSINRSGVVPIQRVAKDNIELCIALKGE